MRKYGFKDYLRLFLFEIIAFIIAVLILIQLLNTDFVSRLITGFAFFRPEYTFTLFVVFTVLTAILLLLLLMQVRRKKLKSTGKQSAFSKTVIREHKIRDMSRTQAAISGIRSESGGMRYLMPGDIPGIKSDMPGDIDEASPHVIELYFNYEEKLNI